MYIIKELPHNKNWVDRKSTKRIILHHAKATTCTVHDINNWHLGQGWNGGIGYHFLVRKDGKTYEGRPINIVGAHTIGYNDDGIGICFEGDFMSEEMSDFQRLAGIELIKQIQTQYGKLKIFRHKDLMDTHCPGINFPDSIVLEGENFQQGHWAERPYKKLIDAGISIHEKRFDDKITRGEMFALLAQMIKKDG